MSLVAAQAAFQHGDQWLDAVRDYIKGNIDYVAEFVRNNLPNIKVIPTEATFLVWLDFSGLGKSPAEVNDLILNKAKVWLNSGALFGKVGENFQRINVACPRSILVEALNRIKSVLY